MTRARRNAPRKQTRRLADRSGLSRLRPWLLAALAALSVARPLLPSEGVAWMGDGLPFDLLWMLLAAAYFLLAIGQGSLARRWNLVDLAVAALVVLSATSAYVGAQHGSPRPAINMLWEWISFGLIYLLTRQLIVSERETRALLAVMIALAVVLASFGFHQVFIGLPADRAAYAANPDQVLRELGQWYPPGSPERLHFENRLQSTEPLATFALTNSLAGFLAPWLIVALGIGLSVLGQDSKSTIKESDRGAPSRLGRLLMIAALAVCILIVAGCLVLTKSRSAYVAVAVGAVLLPICSGAGARLWKWYLAAAAALLVLVVGAVAIKGLDREVLTEASKSLGFRLQYWQATLAMIREHPGWGVGPGNFQDYYTQYKLPEASEEIRDPHNLLLEVWATSGTPAIFALSIALGLFAWRTARTSRPSANVDQKTVNQRESEPGRGAVLIVAGAAMGLVLAFILGPLVQLYLSEERLIGGLLVGGLVLGVLWPWVDRGQLPASLPAVGLLVLGVNLLAAGGIAYPAIAGSFWMLLALSVNLVRGEPQARINERYARPLPLAPMMGLVAIVVLGGACYVSAFAPVRRANAALERAADEHLSTEARESILLEAAAADPLSAEPWLALAENAQLRLRQDPADSQARRMFVTATTRLLELRPHSSTAWRQVGRWYGEFDRKQHGAHEAENAVQCLRRAVDLYPNLASLRAEYALALHAAGDSEAARQQAEMARDLERQTPHADKKLSTELSDELQAIEVAPR